MERGEQGLLCDGDTRIREKRSMRCWMNEDVGAIDCLREGCLCIEFGVPKPFHVLCSASPKCQQRYLYLRSTNRDHAYGGCLKLLGRD